MRKVILNVAISLDGLIEGPNGEFDWCFNDQDYGMTEFFNRIDSIFFGRKSYEVLIKESKGINPFSSKENFVFSHSLPSNDGYILIKGNMADQVNKIKNAVGKDIWLFGGSELTASMIKENLVDELLLAVHPIILGKGKPMFGLLTERLSMKLLSTKSYSSGLISLHYQLNTKQ